MRMVGVVVFHGRPFKSGSQSFFETMDVLPGIGLEIEAVGVFGGENDPEHVAIAFLLPSSQSGSQVDVFLCNVEGSFIGRFPHEIETVFGPGKFGIVFDERGLDRDPSDSGPDPLGQASGRKFEDPRAKLRRRPLSPDPDPDPPLPFLEDSDAVFRADF
jgi:hypothetical protein